MSGFVSMAPVTSEATPVAHDGFFPGIVPAAVRKAQRIPTSVTPERLVDAIVAAMLSIDVELAAWKARQVEAGNETLADVSDATVAGAPRLVRLYERALCSFAAAELVETHHDISASADGQKQIEGRALTADDHRRNATHAIRDIIGATRTAVELI